MSLSLRVGNLASPNQKDRRIIQKIYNDLNQLLEVSGLPKHKDMEKHAERSWSLGSYSNLHYLRRVAAYLDLTSELPKLSDHDIEDASEDPILEEYSILFDSAESSGSSTLYRKFTGFLTYDHLLIHNDSEGYYLPQDFQNVLFASAGLNIPGGIVGSAFKLRTECIQIAQALDIDLSDKIFDRPTNPSRFPIAKFVCYTLHRAAQYSIQTGGILSFE